MVTSPGQPQIAEGLQHRGRGLARRDEHRERIGLRVLHALHVGNEIGVGQRHAHGSGDFAAGFLGRPDDGVLAIVPGAEVAHQGVDPLEFFRRPLAERIAGLPQGERKARDVGRARRDHRGAGVHDDEGDLGLGRERRDRHRVGREDHPREQVHLVAHDQLLRELLGLVGVGAGVVADEELDVHPGRQLFLVLLQVQTHPALHVGPEVAVQPRVAGDEADLDGLGERRSRAQCKSERGGQCEQFFHYFSPPRRTTRLDRNYCHARLSTVLSKVAPGSTKPQPRVH